MRYRVLTSADRAALAQARLRDIESEHFSATMTIMIAARLLERGVGDPAIWRRALAQAGAQASALTEAHDWLVALLEDEQNRSAEAAGQKGFMHVSAD